MAEKKVKRSAEGPAKSGGGGVVSSYNEWDPLEEVIVGSAHGACEMAFEPALGAYHGIDSPGRSFRGARHSAAEIDRANEQLDGFARLLEREGVVVRRPRPVDSFKPYETPDFAVPCGHGHACPRDLLLVVGDEIIEAPMAQRSRFFEYRAYRPLIKEYFHRGARWTTAPKPLMDDPLYVAGYTTEREPFDFRRHPGLTEHEPCFDAACFERFGRDIFWQPDLVSNDFGFRWLQRHLGPGYRLHRIEFLDGLPQHLDATLVPIRPGVVLVNPERPCTDDGLELFRQNGWEILEAPPSVRNGPPAARDVSNWISLNILCLDPGTVIVEEAEEPMMKFLESLGCRVVPCPFHYVYKFGGGFHCCSVDIRRRGRLESYFPSLDN
jgi:glycine amidinotransferase